MKKIVTASLALLFLSTTLSVTAATNLLKECRFSKEAGWSIALTKPVANAGGSIVFDQGKAVITAPDMAAAPYSLHMVKSTSLELNKRYRLRFQARVEAPGVLEIVYGTRKQPYRIYCRQWVKLIEGKDDYEVVLPIELGSSAPTTPDRHMILRLYFGGVKNTKATLEDISLEALVPVVLAGPWDAFFSAKAPDSYGQLPAQLTTPQGERVLPLKVTLTENSLDLATLSQHSVQEGKTVLLYKEFESKTAGIGHIGMAADWWLEAYINGKKLYSTLTTGNKVDTFLPSDHVFTFPVKAGKNLVAVKVLSGSKGWRFVCGLPSLVTPPKELRPNIVFKANERWKAVNLPSLEVKAGSALDQSSLIDAPAGQHGRVIVSPTGTLAFADNPEKPIRLRGFNGIPRAVWQYGTEAQFESRTKRFATAARRQGYRILRLNMLECALSYGVTTDMTLSEKFLRRWDHLLASLKAEGIYSHLVIASYGLFYTPFSFEGEVFKNRNTHKLRMYLGAESERKHWRWGAEKLLNHVNPYTGLAWKDDPAIAVVEFYNEQENGIRKFSQIIEKDGEVKALLENRWRAWLKAQFVNGPTPELAAELKAVPLDQADIPNMLGDRPALSNQFSLFLVDLATTSAKWFEGIVRKTGYSGLVTQYNFSKKMGFTAARWQVAEVVEMNGYFAHPANHKVRQNSSIEQTADYFRSINSTRLFGRPFMTTEFNHAFWNPFQHELGLVFGAYSAFQGFSAIMIHSSPIELTVDKRGVRDFTCSSSPINRANEFLAGCLFQRGDVSPSFKQLDLRLSKEFLSRDKNTNMAVNSSQTKLALLTGFSLSLPDFPAPKGLSVPTTTPAMTLFPGGGSMISGTEWATGIKDAEDNSFNLNTTVATLKTRGILSTSNISDPAKGIFQTDTGEITLRAEEKLMTVITPRTEAVSLLSGRRESLGLLKVENTTVDATIAICSVDGAPLQTSKRLVLLYVTEAANTGMELSADRLTQVKPGALPILLRTGTLTATFKTKATGRMALYPLRLDGSRQQRLPLAVVDGILQLNLDTASLKDGPAVFFELVTEK